MKKALISLAAILLLSTASNAQVYKQTWKQMYDTMTGQATFYAVVNFYIGVTTNPADCFVALLGTGTVRAKEGYFDNVTCPVNSFDLGCRLSTETITRMLTTGNPGEVWTLFGSSPSWGALSGLGIDPDCRISTGALLIRIEQIQIDTTTLANFIYQLNIDTATLEDVKFSRFGGDIQGNTNFSTGTIVTIYDITNSKYMQLSCFTDGESRITSSSGDMVFDALGDIKFNNADLLDIFRLYANYVYAGNIQESTTSLKNEINQIKIDTGTLAIAISNEITNRQNADNTIAIATTTERTERMAADNLLRDATNYLEGAITAADDWDRVTLSTGNYVKPKNAGDNIEPNGSASLGSSDRKFNNLYLSGLARINGGIIVGTDTFSGYSLDLSQNMRFYGTPPFTIQSADSSYLTFGVGSFMNPNYWAIYGKNSSDAQTILAGKYNGGGSSGVSAFEIRWEKDSGNPSLTIAYMPSLISARYMNSLNVCVPDIGSQTQPWENTYSTNVYASKGYIGNIQESTTTERTERIAQDQLIGQATGQISASSYDGTQVAIDTTTLAGQIADNTSRLNQLQVDTATLAAVNNMQNGRLDQLQIDTSTLQGKTEANEQAIAQIKIDTGTLESATTENTNEINQIKIDTGTLAGRVDNAESDILQLRIDTGTLAAIDATQNNRLDQIQIDTTTIAGQTSQIPQLKIDTGTIEAQIGLIEADILQIRIDTGTIESKNIQQDARLNQLQIDTTTLKNIAFQLGVDTATLRSILDQVVLDTASLQSAVLALTNTQNQIRIDTATLQGLVSILTDRMNQVQIDTTTLAAVNTAQTNRLDQLQVDTATLAGANAAQDNRLNQIQIDTTTLANTNAAQNSRLDQIQTDTTTLAAVNTAQSSRLDQIQIDTTTLASVNTTQTSRLNQIQTDTTTLAAVNAAQDGRLNQIQTDTTTLAAVNTTQNNTLNQLQIDTTTLSNQVNAVKYSSHTIAVIFGSTDSIAGNQVGMTADIPITYNTIIKGWCIEENTDTSGSCQIAISSRTWGQTFGRIDGTDIPRLAGQTSSSSTALSGWQTNIAAGGCLRARVISGTSTKQFTLGLYIWKPEE